MRAGWVLLLALLAACDQPPMPQTEEGASGSPAVETTAPKDQGSREER